MVNIWLLLFLRCIEVTPSGSSASLVNAGLFGSRLFLCYRQGGERPPITEIRFVNKKQSLHLALQLLNTCIFLFSIHQLIDFIYSFVHSLVHTCIIFTRTFIHFHPLIYPSINLSINIYPSTQSLICPPIYLSFHQFVVYIVLNTVDITQQGMKR